VKKLMKNLTTTTTTTTTQQLNKVEFIQWTTMTATTDNNISTGTYNDITEKLNRPTFAM
jgi:hypothetical protein